MAWCSLDDNCNGVLTGDQVWLDAQCNSAQTDSHLFVMWTLIVKVLMLMTRCGWTPVDKRFTASCLVWE